MQIRRGSIQAQMEHDLTSKNQPKRQLRANKRTALQRAASELESTVSLIFDTVTLISSTKNYTDEVNAFAPRRSWLKDENPITALA